MHYRLHTSYDTSPDSPQSSSQSAAYQQTSPRLPVTPSHQYHPHHPHQHQSPRAQSPYLTRHHPPAPLPLPTTHYASAHSSSLQMHSSSPTGQSSGYFPVTLSGSGNSPRHYQKNFQANGGSGGSGGSSLPLPALLNSPTLLALEKRASSRSAMDRDVIFHLLRSIDILSEHLDDRLLHQLTTHVHYQQFRHMHTVLFHQGDRVLNWYVTLSGTLLEISEVVGHPSGQPEKSLHLSALLSPHRSQLQCVQSMNGGRIVQCIQAGEVFGFEYPQHSWEPEEEEDDYGEYHDRDPRPVVRQSTVLTETSCHLLFFNWHDSQKLLSRYWKPFLGRCHHLCRAFAQRRAVQPGNGYRMEEELERGREDEREGEEEEIEEHISAPGLRFPSSSKMSGSRSRGRHLHHRRRVISNSNVPALRGGDLDVMLMDEDSQTEQKPNPLMHSRQSSTDRSNKRHRTGTVKPTSAPVEDILITETVEVPTVDPKPSPTSIDLGLPGEVSNSHDDPPTHPGQDTSNVLNAALALYNHCVTSLNKTNDNRKKSAMVEIWSGANLVQWLGEIIRSEDRLVVKGVWQVLLDETLLVDGSADESRPLRRYNSEFFDDDRHFYRFSRMVVDTAHNREDNSSGQDGGGGSSDALNTAMATLLKYSPDAVFRVILQRPPMARKPEELDFVFNELLNLKALSHLSSMVKRELAGVMELEMHLDSVGQALFHQGDEGTSWYIILRGAVDVHISGKGVVCSLKEGDDFGKLALMNHAPRAATIILKEKFCQFLTVHKVDFDRILLDVEANTMRLKEHDKDVLILARTSSGTNNMTIIAGTLEKIIENILESKINVEKDFESIGDLLTSSSSVIDFMIRDLIYTYPMFATVKQLVDVLQHYFISTLAHTSASSDEQSAIRKQRAVILFLCMWFRLLSHQFVEEKCLESLLDKLLNSLKTSATATREKRALKHLLEQSQSVRHSFENRRNKQRNQRSGVKVSNVPVCQTDMMTVDVYFSDKSRHQIHIAANSSVQSIVNMVLEQSDFHKLENPRLCEVKSSGEIVAFRPSDLGVTYRIGKRSRLFVASSHELKELTPLPQQLSAMDSNANYLELVNVEEFAAAFCHYDWEQLINIQTHEFIFATFGRESFDRISPNLDIMSRRFSQVQYWVVSEVVLAQNMHKRATLIRKIIKLAFTLLHMKNINTFIAIIMGLSHSAVARLRQTWDKVPNKQQKIFKEFSTLLDPSKNHRVLRQKMLALRPPHIPFIALLLKDITFIHEGNQTHIEDGLINFEKVQLLGKVIANFEEARGGDANASNFLGPTKRDRNYDDMRSFIDNLSCMEDQRRLTNLSLKLEGKK